MSLILLSACATDKPRKVILGDEVSPPYGYIEMCRRDPESLACR